MIDAVTLQSRHTAAGAVVHRWLQKHQCGMEQPDFCLAAHE